jgi:hypothetical protein
MLFNPRWRGDGDDGFVRRRNALAVRINGLNFAMRAARSADPELNMRAAIYELNCAVVFLEGWRLDAAEESLRDAEQAFAAEQRRLQEWRSPAVQARQQAYREFVETLRLHIPAIHPYGKMVFGEYLYRMRDAALANDAAEFARLAGMITKRVSDELYWHAVKVATFGDFKDAHRLRRQADRFAAGHRFEVAHG